MLAVIAFLIGLAVGSFLNVVILRGERQEKLNGRSRCESCGKTLSVLELIPLISYIIQKGRCRSCGIVLSLQYPLMELTTAILFALSAWYVMPLNFFSLKFLYSLITLLAVWVTLSAGVVIMVSDFKFFLVPNGAVLALALAGIIFTFSRAGYGFSSLAVNWEVVFRDIIFASIFMLFLGSLWFFSQGRWMGFGDVKLIFAASLLVGFPASLAALLFSFWSGAIGAIILFLFRKKTMKDLIPFGPYILLGTALANFFANDFFRISGLIGLL